MASVGGEMATNDWDYVGIGAARKGGLSRYSHLAKYSHYTDPITFRVDESKELEI